MSRTKILNDKNQIIDAAFQIMDEEGESALSIRRIAKAVGVSSMTIYNYVQNIEEIKHEIVIRCFHMLYAQIYKDMSNTMEHQESGLVLYAKIYAKELFDFATEHRWVCQYLNGAAYLVFHDDPELRPFYDPFSPFLRFKEENTQEHELRMSCQMFESALRAMIMEYTSGTRTYTRQEFEESIYYFLERMFPKEI